MATVKINNGRCVFGDNGFEVNSGDADSPEEYMAIVHDTDDALKTIGKGSEIIIHEDPTILADDGFVDLPAGTAGRGFILVGDAEEHVDFSWASDDTVTLIDNSANVAATDSDTDFCIFDNSGNVRIRNRLGTAKRIVFNGSYYVV